MKLPINQLPLDIVNHYRCERRSIFSADKKGSSTIVVKTRITESDPKPLKTIWRKRGDSWVITTLDASTFELPAPIGSKPKTAPGTLWGVPVPVVRER